MSNDEPPPRLPSFGAIHDSPFSRLLVVVAAKKDGSDFPDDIEAVKFVTLQEVDDALLAAFDPDVVFSALTWNDTDAVELALVLNDLNFAGRYCIVAVGVTNADVILNDIRANARTLDIDLIEVDQ